MRKHKNKKKLNLLKFIAVFTLLFEYRCSWSNQMCLRCLNRPKKPICSIALKKILLSYIPSSSEIVYTTVSTPECALNSVELKTIQNTIRVVGSYRVCNNLALPSDGLKFELFHFKHSKFTAVAIIPRSYGTKQTRQEPNRKQKKNVKQHLHWF